MTEEQFLYPTHTSFISDAVIAGRPVKDLITEIQAIYASDDRPWIIGFSGGKDSTCVLSLIFFALQSLPEDERNKPIYVVSSDTLVETPVVVDMIHHMLELINDKAQSLDIPITAHPVHPLQDQTFWVNLLGRGYPAPRQSFRWCTERMKIDPVSSFITQKANQFGEVIVALGSRSQESASRAQVIAKHKIDGSSLSRHTSLPNAYTYMPIEDWSADDVWEYLMSAPTPWGGSNRMLLELYKGSNQGECPLVIDTSTPSCGNSRFGCWTCTVVNEDKALHSLINNGEEWMAPLLEFRNALYESTRPELKTEYRNYKRRTGKVSYMNNKEITEDTEQEKKHIPGPYWMDVRKKWLKDLLEIEHGMRSDGHAITLVQRYELHEIRQQWLRDPNEPDWHDSLPKLFHEIYPNEQIQWIENDAGAFTQPDAELLASLSNKHGAPAELLMKLIEAEVEVGTLGNRRGIMNKLKSILNQDWDNLETINERNAQQERHNSWKDKLTELQQQYDMVSSK
ncbi:Uncharacterised protein [BD1-7 clade bacterium]|uniref:Phosphoadenosine phosphosulphate reductase domain-containing protein n=1 Tax=BD1-7 clade bacterium TaxID=2029982 RepID=A0A5S9QVL0_9GAMM|nr:Uncharacterised protein [BD1-7 clade bacterium]CAA0122966.1 Uncharacterised protein [BD1-7 clade bacterium]